MCVCLPGRTTTPITVSHSAGSTKVLHPQVSRETRNIKQAGLWFQWKRCKKPVLGSEKLETGSDKKACLSELCVGPPHLPQPGLEIPSILNDPFAICTTRGSPLPQLPQPGLEIPNCLNDCYTTCRGAGSPMLPQPGLYINNSINDL